MAALPVMIAIAVIVVNATLFGLGLRSEVFGVELPGLSHTVDFTVDQYKPGVFV